MADRRTLLIGGGAVVVIAVVASVIVIGPSDLFVPEQSTQVNETPADSDAEVVKRGTFTGAAGHDVSGTVKLHS